MVQLAWSRLASSLSYVAQNDFSFFFVLLILLARSMLGRHPTRLAIVVVLGWLATAAARQINNWRTAAPGALNTWTKDGGTYTIYRGDGFVNQYSTPPASGSQYSKLEGSFTTGKNIRVSVVVPLIGIAGRIVPSPSPTARTSTLTPRPRGFPLPQLSPPRVKQGAPQGDGRAVAS